MFCFLKVEQPAAKQYDAVLRIRKAVHISFFLRIKRFIRNMHVFFTPFFLVIPFIVFCKTNDEMMKLNKVF